MVASDKGKSGRYLLLDGHLRLEAAKQLGLPEIVCLVSTDDEAFTYNKHISRLSPVQEHRMLLKAIERGVPIARIAQVLNIEPESINKKKNLLEGICPEALDLLKDKMVPTKTFPLLRRMKVSFLP